MTIMGICLIIIGALTIIWGVTLTHGIQVTNPDFLSFAVGGMVVIAIGSFMMSTMPTPGKITALWLAGVSVAWYVWCLDMDVIVKLMSFVMIAGFAAWLTTQLI